MTQDERLTDGVTAAAVCVPPPSGMVGWYKAENTAVDDTGNSNGTLVDGTFAAGMVGQAFSFDGVDDYVTAPAVAAQDPTTAGSLDAWVNLNQTPATAGHHMVIISKGAFGADFDIEVETDNRVHFYVAGGVRVASTTVLTTGVWYHVAGTWDSTGLRIYVNGTLDTTNPTSGVTRPQSNLPLRIGDCNAGGLDSRCTTTRPLNGLIDEAQVFDRRLSDSEVAAAFNAGSSGTCPLSAGLEADVAPRSQGDGFLLSNDVTIIRQLVVGTATPDPNTNEFQRADSAPRATSGDGLLTSADTIQARRYVAGLDPTQPAGGPMQRALPSFDVSRQASGDPAAIEKPRKLSVIASNASPGNRVTVSIEMTGRGDELAASFTLAFDPAKLSNPHVELGPDVSPGTVLTVNSGSAAKGMLCILLDSNEPVNRSTWTPKLVTITFDVAQTAHAGRTKMSFSDTLAHRSLSDAEGDLLPAIYENGVVDIFPGAPFQDESGINGVIRWPFL